MSQCNLCAINMGTSLCQTGLLSTGHKLLHPKQCSLSNMLRREKRGEMSATGWQAFLPTVTNITEKQDRYFLKVDLAPQGESLQGSELQSELHLTTVSFQVLSKTPLTAREALWIAYNKLPKPSDAAEE